MQLRPLTVLAGLTAVMFVASCSKQANSGYTIPGIVRQSERVYLMENHSTALLVWHSLAVKGATLVHVDTHDDFRPIETDRLVELRNLLDRKKYNAIAQRSDNEWANRFKTRPDRFLYDLGNFIYPCMQYGMITNFIWVVPDTSLSSNRILQLMSHFQNMTGLVTRSYSTASNSFSVTLAGGSIQVLTLESLPQLAPGALLDVDTDFFVFSEALSAEHTPGRLAHDVPSVCNLLTQRVPEPACITVASSVPGMYTPLQFRFLADACFDFLATGEYPRSAVRFLEFLSWIRTQGTVPPAPLPAPAEPAYLPAYRLLQGLTALMEDREPAALTSYESAAVLSPIYRRGLIDLCDLFMKLGRNESAGRALDLHDRLTCEPTTEGIAARVRLDIAEGNLEEAHRNAARLLEWDRQPYFLLLYASVLSRQESWGEAGSIYEEVLRKSPGEVKAVYSMGVVLERQKRPVDAARWYKAAIEMKPGFTAAHENLGHLLLAIGDLEAARQSLVAANALNPGNPVTMNNLGLLARRQGAIEEAVRMFSRAVAVNGGIPVFQLNLVDALIVAGRTNDASTALNTALLQHPGWKSMPQVVELTRRLDAPPEASSP